MALITTPSDPSANSYVTLAEANAYFEDRSDVSDWTSLTDDQKEAVLKLATKHIDTFRFHGNEIMPLPAYYRDKQRLKFPRTTARKKSGVVDSAGNDYFIDSARADEQHEPDDFWIDGCVIIKDGTGKGQTRKISDFDMATGKITVSENWTTNPDTTSDYLVVEKIQKEVKDATCEQAFYITNGGGERAKMQAEGVASYDIGDLSETFRDGMGAGKIAISNEAKGLLKGIYTIIGKLTV
jgi:hypothetical protein